MWVNGAGRCRAALLCSWLLVNVNACSPGLPGPPGACCSCREKAHLHQPHADTVRRGRRSYVSACNLF